ncbi:MAG: HigA family addiction module antidote protein [Aestuariivirga sp.]|uniref:HigA family addiction module antitoxin n=1 Tax=Aestuariivirga sp. TaxID=2650926 RepID=UPI0025C31E34|nr:HigA family addiction module antitoxin [Aestuariivirga sp.]MCA3560987.1 HigA family addiction module antidote protein [Aestuariivirga sp.]
MPQSKPVPVDHPGTFIKEELEARGWEQVDLAYILGVLPQALSPLFSGKAGITPDMAASLGAAFDMPPDFFANLQKMYDLNKAKPVDPGVRTRASWVSHFPVRDMIKRGWIEDTEPGLLDLQMMRFFGKNRIEDIPWIGRGEIAPGAFRLSGNDYEAAIGPLQYTWLHRVIKIAETVSAPLYSEDKLRGSLSKIRSHLLDREDLKHIPSILREAGVRFVLVEALPGSKVDGVCVWIDGQPAIGMTTRLDRLDNFAFVLRHECEHVLRGDGRDVAFVPVDCEMKTDPDSQDGSEIERRANEAAAEFCVPKQHLTSFILRKSPFISEQDVLAFAARMEIHPAIVVGQVQHKTNKYNWLRKYQTSVREHLFGWQYVDGWGRQCPTGL